MAMTSLTSRIQGLTPLLVVLFIGLTLATGGENEGGGFGGTAVALTGRIAFHASFGIMAFVLVLGHIVLNRRSAVFKTKRLFSLSAKGNDLSQRLNALVPLLLLPSLGLAILTGLMDSGLIQAGRVVGEGEGGLHAAFIGLTILLGLVHMALNSKMLMFQLTRAFSLGGKRG